jgi:hypothetical protein
MAVPEIVATGARPDKAVVLAPDLLGQLLQSRRCLDRSINEIPKRTNRSSADRHRKCGLGHRCHLLHRRLHVVGVAIQEARCAPKIGPELGGLG